MAEKKTCRSCGEPTVTEAKDGICFSCQIRSSEAEKAQSSSFFFDDDQRYTPPEEDLEVRVKQALTTIEIDKEIGRGAMGVVFVGRQTKLNRRVAVKVLTPHPDLHGILTNRFMIEAQTMAILDHPNIVTIFDFGQTDCGLSYIVMEWIDGKSLLELLNEEETPTRELLNLMSQVCEALGFAHEQDVIHRDMKPENILIDVSGKPKVADFGLAKLEGESHASRLTKTHQMLGTPMYMAPEQAVSSGTVDFRADLYAIGVMLYEILTGTLPGKAPEPPSKRQPQFRALDSVVMTLLKKDPEARKVTAVEVALACATCANQSTPSEDSSSLFGRFFRKS